MDATNKLIAIGELHSKLWFGN